MKKTLGMCISVLFYGILAMGVSFARVLDSFESIDWARGLSNGASLTLSATPGKSGNAMKLDFSMTPEGQWAQVDRDFLVPDVNHSTFSFWVKGSGDPVTLEFKLVDADGSNFGKRIKNVTSISEWKKIVITPADLEYFWGGDQTMDQLKKIYIAVSIPTGATGKVLIDELSVIREGEEVKEEKSQPGNSAANISTDGDILDGFENTAGWSKGAADGAKIKIKLVPGKNGSALSLKYELTPTGQWVQIDRDFDIADLKGGEFTFWVKGTGDPCRIELKCVDEDGTNFGKSWEGLTATPEWRKISIPFSSMTYFWGGDKVFAHLKKIYIAVSSPNGGTGEVLLDDLGFSK